MDKSDKVQKLEIEHRKEAHKAIAVSAVGLAVTGSIELLIALLTGSVALLGDAIHNLADVSTSAVLFLGFKISKKKPNRIYSYGYEKAEDIAGFGVSIVIWASAVFTGLESYHKLTANSTTVNVFIGMLAAIIGMSGNFIVSRYKLRVSKKINSLAMEAEAKHSWLDVVSSFGALIGLIGVSLGYKWADPVAGFLITLFILHIGYEVTKEFICHLMDGVDEEHLEMAEKAVQKIPELESFQVRGRWMGRSLIIEVDGKLPGNTSIDESNRIGKEVENIIQNEVEEAKIIRFIPR